VLPTLAHIQAATTVYRQLKGWQASNDSLRQLFVTYSGNVQLPEVLAKVAALDALYGTNLMAHVSMGRNIIGIQHRSAAGHGGVQGSRRHRTGQWAEGIPGTPDLLMVS
jgi:hypothetical protein